MQYFEQNHKEWIGEIKWNKEEISQLEKLTNLSFKQITKFLWDRNHDLKKRRIGSNKITFPGLIFQIHDVKNNKELTPTVPLMIDN